MLRERAAHLLLGHVLGGLVLVHQDGEQVVPDLVPRLVVRRAGGGGVERLGPLRGAEPDLGPRRLDLHALGGCLLVQPDGGLDRADHRDRRLQRRDGWVPLGHRRAALRHQVAQRAGPHALLAEAGQHVADVRQVGPGRPDEEDAAAAVVEPRVRVEQVRRPVQRDDRLAGARSAVDDECAARPGPDDGVLVGLDRAEDVPHPCRAGRPEGGDERRLVVERGVPLETVGREHLVPVVGDLPESPPVPAAAEQPHRLGVGRAEERLGGGGAPVDEQPAAGPVGEPEPPDVDRALVGDHPAQAQVEVEAAQRPQPGGQPVDLLVAVERLLAGATGCEPGRLEALGQVGDRLREAGGDRGEVLLVGGDEGRVVLGGQVPGEVEGTHDGRF